MDAGKEQMLKKVRREAKTLEKIQHIFGG